MASDPSNLIIFTGEFCHGVDPKNRITIPSDWRSGNGDSYFVKVDATSSFIVVMPPDEFRRVRESVESEPNISNRERQQFVRHFAAESLACSADKQGRMVLPPEFCAKIGLQGEATLVGAYGRFEIWNPTRRDSVKTAEEASNRNIASQLGV